MSAQRLTIEVPGRDWDADDREVEGTLEIASDSLGLFHGDDGNYYAFEYDLMTEGFWYQIDLEDVSKVREAITLSNLKEIKTI